MNSHKQTRSQVERLGGLYPPMILPLDSRQEIDFASLERQIHFLLDGGVDGLWVNGTTGDFFALTDEERTEVVRQGVRTVNGRVPVVAQVGDTATRKVIAKASEALDAGADFLAVVLPYYLDYTQSELMAHYRAISRSVRRPLILYQVPQMCKVSLTIPSILELARDGVLVGIKDSSANIEFFSRLTSAVREADLSLRCFIGTGALMDVSLMAGGHGLMCAIANLVPHRCKRLYEAFQTGDWRGATEIQREVSELIEAMRLPQRQNWGATVAIYKWLLRELGVIANDAVFAPLQPLSKGEKNLLRRRALPLAKRLIREHAVRREARSRRR